MKQNRSIDEALHAAKALRKQATPNPPQAESEVPSESHLKVVDPTATSAADQAPSTSNLQTDPQWTQASQHPTTAIFNHKPIWVRHTVGLREFTSLNLRDAADDQKRKERRGQLQPGEPANEQEIADLGIRLALEHLGFVSKTPGT